VYEKIRENTILGRFLYLIDVLLVLHRLFGV